MSFSMSRYRLLKFLIPSFLGFYLFMVWLKPVIGVTHNEIFPFFSWNLFSGTPGSYTTENALIVHSIDGSPVSGTRYLIPNRDISDQKALKSTVRDCRILSGCDQAVKRRLYPIVNRLTRGEDVEFSIITARIDLREVQRGIASLAKGEAKRTDFFRQDRFIGRWTTGGGRVWASNWDGDYESAGLLLRSHFDVYRSENNLIYVRDSCSQADTDARFFLHVYPVDANDLPNDRKQYGFDNLGFNFGDYRFRFDADGRCMTVRELPAYEIRRIRVGQFISGQEGHIWEGNFEFARPRNDR